jgi:hypothetical protein
MVGYRKKFRKKQIRGGNKEDFTTAKEQCPFVNPIAAHDLEGTILPGQESFVSVVGFSAFANSQKAWSGKSLETATIRNSSGALRTP